MNRRRLLTSLISTPPLLLLGGITGLPAVLAQAELAGRTISKDDVERMRSNWKNYMPADYQAPSADDKLQLSESAWRERLTPQEFAVLREEDTEQPFTSPLNEETRDGLFVCAGCGLPLFTSAMKFDSGTGWPSFITAIPGAFETKQDFVLLIPRTEYHCARCGGHHGHVFNDGPPPLGKRWCSNGVAMDFWPVKESAELTA